jgi:hypothetical protein
MTCIFQRPVRGFLLLGALVCATIIGGRFLFAQQRSEAAIVATVNNVEVVYSQIRVSEVAVKRRFAAEFGRQADGSADADELGKIVRNLEIDALAKRIRAIVRDQETARLNVNVSDEEVRARWEDITRGQDVPGKLGEAAETLSILLASLEDVCVNGLNADQMYQERLQGRMPKAQWDGHVKYDCDPTRRRLLADFLARGGPEKTDYRETVRDIIRGEKLRVGVDTELARSDPEYAEFMRPVQGRSQNDRDRSTKPPTYRDAKHYEWWQARYREAKVEIQDERFKDAWPPKTNE